MPASVFPTFVQTWHSTSYDSIDPRKNPQLSAEGKTVVVTGGGRGIGPHIAASFAAAHAAHVVLIGRTPSTLEAEQKSLAAAHPQTTFHIYPADIADTHAVETVFASIARSIGPIDILVSNAAYLSAPAPLRDADVADWWLNFQTNVLGGMNVARSFLRHAAADSPVLINVSTAISHLPVFQGFSAYGGSKEAFVRVLDFVAAENPHVRIVNVHPGVLKTDMNIKSGSELPFDHISLPADFIVWAASPEAEFLKGRYVWSNWDVDELKAMKDDILERDLLVMGLRGWPNP